MSAMQRALLIAGMVGANLDAILGLINLYLALATLFVTKKQDKFATLLLAKLINGFSLMRFSYERRLRRKYFFPLKFLKLASCWIATLLLCSACSVRHLIIQGVADELANQGQAVENDLVLAHEASAFYLKLSESLLRETPGNLNLAEAVAGGFTQYAFAFVAFEADRIEAKDTKAAQKLRVRAALLYERAYRHAMAALEAGNPGFAKALAQTDSSRWPHLSNVQTGVAYWAAVSWGGWISLSKDKPETVADLPLAIRLAALAYAVNPAQGKGALASLMGTFEAVRPGGSVSQATLYFDQAIHLAAGNNVGIFVAKAESIAQPAGDRAMFEALLRQALAVSKRDIANEVMRERAQWLLDNVDDLF